MLNQGLNKGYFFAFSAFLLWGLLPIYWSWLNFASALEVLMHRMIWSFPILILILYQQKKLNVFERTFAQKKILYLHIISTLLITLNWGTFIWAIQNNFVIETSLGYFISPIFSVFLGVLIFKEKLRKLQWVAVGIIFISLAYLTWAYGKIPWIAISLTLSWGLYGVCKKKSHLSSIESLSVETAILLIPAIITLAILYQQSQIVFLQKDILFDWLLISSGMATLVPLLLFGVAVRLLNLSTIGLIQYLGPTIQFILGIYYFNESFDLNRFIGFCFVWIALLIYIFEGLKHKHKNRKSKLKNKKQRI